MQRNVDDLRQDIATLTQCITANAQAIQRLTSSQANLTLGVSNAERHRYNAQISGSHDRIYAIAGIEGLDTPDFRYKPAIGFPARVDHFCRLIKPESCAELSRWLLFYNRTAWCEAHFGEQMSWQSTETVQEAVEEDPEKGLQVLAEAISVPWTVVDEFTLTYLAHQETIAAGRVNDPACRSDQPRQGPGAVQGGAGRRSRA